MPARRSHTKSRNGCSNCRTRRIKCDEAYPVCGQCSYRAIDCHFDRGRPKKKISTATLAARLRKSQSPEIAQGATPKKKKKATPANVQGVIIERAWGVSSPASRPSPTPSNHLDSGTQLSHPHPSLSEHPDSMVKLRLLHHFTYVAANPDTMSHPRLRYFWAYELPAKAMTHDPLMDALLAFSALHLHILTPNDHGLSSTSHQYYGTALRKVNQEIANWSTDVAELTFGASITLSFRAAFSWQDPCMKNTPYTLPLQWIHLTRGATTVFIMSQQTKVANIGGPMEVPFPDTSTIPLNDDPFELLKLALPSDFDSEEEQTALYKTLDQVSIIYRSILGGADYLPGLARLTRFPAFLDPVFLRMLQEGEPRAMVVLAYFFGVMKEAEDVWWLNGWADHEINGILGLMPEECMVFMEWPCRQLVEKNREGVRLGLEALFE
ncbi:hypothetical protein K402DRAFT_320696 [Aulographum hederae CBS 113979]|uniref:Zn(2)-C6 fungal-type domain-containing protein n=1 Tax=Aulographum hederae CBS 113979 TaxID=1176131 RepID=A0A6G1HH66_9PEZI|nr:hypothetical protein K402DRAFT_320696 [Aulographum hederae CBS 113979]